MDYKKEAIKLRLKTFEADYKNFKIDQAQAFYENLNNKMPQREIFDLWEIHIAGSQQPRVGFIDENGDLEVKGEFLTYLHKGSYVNLAQTCGQVAQDYPERLEFYCVHLNSPTEVPEEELEVKIILKIKN